jgi:polyphosphate kinase
MDVLGQWHTFRITRYSDLDVRHIDEPEDLLATIEEQVFQRRFGEVVRLEVQTDMPRTCASCSSTSWARVTPDVAPLTAVTCTPGPLLDLAT